MTALVLDFQDAADPAILASHAILGITGTSTGVGKTMVTGLLAQLMRRRQTVITQKWVQSGDTARPDIAIHDQVSGHTESPHWQPYRQVYTFPDPVSPHLAAELSNTRIDPDRLIAATNTLTTAATTVLIETSGGIMVPLTPTVVMGDVLATMAIPTLVVVPNQLGAINQALLTLHYMATRGIPCLGFMMTQQEPAQSPLHTNNPRAIAHASGARWLGVCRSVA